VSGGPSHLLADADLAVVGTRLHPGSPLRLADEDPAPSAPVTVAGYPEGRTLEVSHARVMDYVPGAPRAEQGTVMRVSMSPRPGMSGGPVLDATGRLAGLVYAVEGQSGYGLVIPASRLRRRTPC
jgi:S1-C subfamily serine protease